MKRPLTLRPLLRTSRSVVLLEVPSNNPPTTRREERTAVVAGRIGQAAHRSRPRSYLRAQTADCEVPRSARDDRSETTTAPDRPGTGTKDKSCRARNILRRLPQSA